MREYDRELIEKLVKQKMQNQIQSSNAPQVSTQSTNQKDNKLRVLFAILILVMSLLIIKICVFEAEPSSSTSYSRTYSQSSGYHTCGYCHKSELCDRYFMVLNDNVWFDSNGEVQMTGDYVWFSKECYDEWWRKYSYEVFHIVRK